VNAAWSFVRSILRSTLFVALLLAAAVDCKIRRPRVGAEGAIWIHGWCRRIVKALGFVCNVEGRIPTDGAVVSNHLSYLDILLYSSVQPFVMIAKTEVRSWPILGWLTAQAGTVYVERGGGPKTHSAVNAAMAEAYHSGLPVLFFPEGTTTDGASVLPFRRGLFHSILNNQVPLRVAALQYTLPDCFTNREATVANEVCWWGDAQFTPHIFRLLGLSKLHASIHFGEETTARADRFILSETAHATVAQMYEELSRTSLATVPLESDASLAEAL
jgi:lyso-ornithine lipid O-acyltransferase